MTWVLWPWLLNVPIWYSILLYAKQSDIKNHYDNILINLTNIGLLDIDDTAVEEELEDWDRNFINDRMHDEISEAVMHPEFQKWGLMSSWGFFSKKMGPSL